MGFAESLQADWRSRLQSELPNHPQATQTAIVQWLIGAAPERLEDLKPELQTITAQAMDYRYRILRQRYLGVGPERGYQRLIQRLSGMFVLRNKIRTWIALSRDRHQRVTDVLQEVIQELLRSDKYLQQQLAWIAQCTDDRRLRNTLLLTTVEEYCLRPIRNQPLIAYRFVNYLRRSQRGGMTQVPSSEFIRLVSEEIAPDDADGAVSLLDHQAIADYQLDQSVQEQQEMRQLVQQQFADYLEQTLDTTAAEWLRLYLQGETQEAIANQLNLPIKQVYRLREKVSYHAIRVFADKKQPELVASWLGTRDAPP